MALNLRFCLQRIPNFLRMRLCKARGAIILISKESPERRRGVLSGLLDAEERKPVPVKTQPVETLPLPGIPRKRGRPSTGKALSVAERQRRSREKHKVLDQHRLEAAAQSFENETDEELYSWLATSGPTLQEKAWIEIGRRKGWKLAQL